MPIWPGRACTAAGGARWRVTWPKPLGDRLPHRVARRPHRRRHVDRRADGRACVDLGAGVEQRADRLEPAADRRHVQRRLAVPRSLVDVSASGEQRSERLRVALAGGEDNGPLEPVRVGAGGGAIGGDVGGGRHHRDGKQQCHACRAHCRVTGCQDGALTGWQRWARLMRPVTYPGDVHTSKKQAKGMKSLCQAAWHAPRQRAPCAHRSVGDGKHTTTWHPRTEIQRKANLILKSLKLSISLRICYRTFVFA